MKTDKVRRRLFDQNKIRFEGKFYLNDDSINSRIVETHKEMCVKLSAVAEVFNPPIFKRQFCKATGNAVPYFQSSDVPVNTDSSTVYVYRPQIERIGALVEKGDILITGFGTIGNIRLVSSRMAGVCFANNVCRVRCPKDAPIGYYYAFLASKYGRSQLNKNASGAVVRYIEAPGIKNTLVPLLPASRQAEIDGLVREAAALRDRAGELLRQAKGLLQAHIGDVYTRRRGCRTARKAIKDVRASLKLRLDPPVYINDGVDAMNALTGKTQRLGECKVRLFYPGMFKRAYVEKGLPYMKGSDVFDVNPFAHCQYLSKSRTPKLDQLWLTDGMILITCAGACGLVKLITKEYEDKSAIGSPDIIRLVSDDPLFTPEYLYTYLSLPYVYDYMQSLKYGAVIERFDIQNIASLPVVIPSPALSQRVTSLIREYKSCTYRAFRAEEAAISQIETEISRWGTTH